MNKVGLYFGFPGGAGFERVGAFVVEPASGAAVLEVSDERVRDRLENLTKGVTGRADDVVLPADGTRFLRALADRYATSSYWDVVDESEGLDSRIASQSRNDE